MTLDTTQILILALIEGGLALQILLWYTIRLLAGGPRAPSFPVPPPSVVVPPTPVPVPVPVPGPLGPPDKPPVVPDKPTVVVTPPVTPPVPPVTARTPRNTGVTATAFAGLNDSKNSRTSAYTGKLIDSTKPGFALPKHLSTADQHRAIRVFWNGKSVDGPPVDVGPFYDGRPGWPIDPYWENGTRPRAETDNRTNHAGIDLTPGAWQALGHPDPTNVKDKVDWDWVDYLNGALAPVVPAPVGPQTVGGTVLVHHDWPKQSQALAFFGPPGSNLVKVTCPWELTVEGTKSHAITIHQKAADSLIRVLNYIWEQCGKSQEKINEFGYNVFDGSFNERNIAGTGTPSQHSWGAAMDWNAAANPQHAPLTRTKFKKDSLIVQAFKAEGWTWGGDWTPSSIDAMHVQLLGV